MHFEGQVHSSCQVSVANHPFRESRLQAKYEYPIEADDRPFGWEYVSDAELFQDGCDRTESKHRNFVLFEIYSIDLFN